METAEHRSRMNREVHVWIWERPELRLLWAKRHYGRVSSERASHRRRRQSCHPAQAGQAADQDLALHLPSDWRLKENAKADVRQTIREEFDELPEVYDRRLWKEKVERTFQFMFERYPGEIAAPMSTASLP